jgi:hypothetical protein
MAAVAVFPSAAAVIVAWPFATPTTSPVCVTLAMLVLLLVQVIVRPVSVLPPASRAVAVSCTVCPTATPAVVCDSAIVAMATCGGVTVTCDDPLVPPAVAVMGTGPPAATPGTMPADDTVAIAVFDVVQFVTTFVQFDCVTAAVRVPVAPATTLKVGGVTTTDVTEHWGGVTPPSPPPPHPTVVAARMAMTARDTRNGCLERLHARLTDLLLKVEVRPVGYALATTFDDLRPCAVIPRGHG